MANQVGAAYISIMPSMDGFAGRTARMFGANGTACGSKFSGGFNRGMGGLKTASATFGAFGTKMAAIAGAVAGTVQTGITAAMGAISNSIGAAVSRVDTMAAFPRVLSGLGYQASDASAAIQKMSDHLTGLPTRLDAMTSSVQKIVPTVKDVGKSTDIMLAFNDALLAGGASTQVQEAALEQFAQTLAKGKPELEDWRSIQTAMPGQLDQVAKKLLGASASSQDLYEAMKTGKVSIDDFTQAFVDLDQQGLDGFASFAEQAKAGTAGIATSMANLQNSVVKSVAGVIQAFGADRISGAAQAMTVQIKAAGDLAAQAVSNLMGWVDQLGAKLQENGAAEAFSNAMSTLGQAVSDLGGFIGGVLSAITGLDGSEQSAASAADVLKGAMDALQPIIQAVGNACAFLKDHASQLAPIITALAGAFAAFKVVDAVSQGLTSVGKATEELPKKAPKGTSAIEKLAEALKKVQPKNILSIAVAFIALGAGVLLASVGLGIIAAAAIQLAAAGPGAVVVMVGMVVAIALLAAGAAAIGPALTAGAVGMIAFGAAIALIGVGILAATAGMSMLAQQLPIIAQYGTQGAVGIAALGVGCLVLGAGALVAGLGLVVMGAGLVIVAAGAVLAAAGCVLLAAGAVVLGAALIVVGVGAMIAGPGLMLVASAVAMGAPYVLVMGAGALVLGAALIVVGVGAMLAGAGLVLVGAGAAMGAATIGLLAAAMGLLGGSLGIVSAGLTAIAGAMGALGASASVVCGAFNQMAGSLPSIAGSGAAAAGSLTAVGGAAGAAAGGLATLAGACAAAGSCATAAAAMGSLSGQARSMSSGVSGAANSASSGMRNLASSCQSAMSTCGNSFNSFVNSARNAGNQAMSAIRTCVSNIQSSVNGMRLTIPRINVGALPHFHMNGKFDPQSGSVPSVSVSWYAKGGLFGANSPHLIGVGDNRRYDEAVLPLSPKVLGGIGAGIDVDGGGDGSLAVLQWLDQNLPYIIQNYTPTMTDRDFNRKVRAAV